MKLILQTGRDFPGSFAVKSATRLRLLNVDGQEINSGQDADLVRRPRLEIFEPRLTLDGMYTNVSGAGRFKECLTERGFSVLEGAQQRVLENAYAKARLTPIEPLLATIEGRISERHDMDSGDQHVVAVEQFINIWPAKPAVRVCPQFSSKTPIGNWCVFMVTRSRGRPDGSDVSAPVSDGKKLQGFAGCNRITGGYVLEETLIRIIELAPTRMACDDLMEEKEFLNALSLAATWKIHSNHLELYGADGQVRGRFELKPTGRP